MSATNDSCNFLNFWLSDRETVRVCPSTNTPLVSACSINSVRTGPGVDEIDL